MRLLLLNPPGRFPTVVHDPGPWWDVLLKGGADSLEAFSLNFHWWRLICSPQMLGVPARGGERTAEWDSLRDSALRAEAGLSALMQAPTFADAERYVAAVAAVAEHLERLNAAQDEFEVSLAAGPVVAGVDYAASRSLAAFAERPSLLASTIAQALNAVSESPDLVAFRLTSEFDVLTALVAARCLRERFPSVHLSLIDHGYENFSLEPHLPILRATGALARFFDTIVASKDDIDRLVPDLVDRLRGGEAPRGFLTADTSGAPAQRRAAAAAPPLVPIFSPEPVLHTRASRRRCYWSHCTFCTQNAKYADPKTPSKAEVRGELARLRAAVDAGCRNVIFTDEAISPATLRVLSDEIERASLGLRWACRCKLERSFSPELLEAAARAGCREILFGLETTSERLLRRMGKHVEGLDADGVAAIFGWLRAAGIGIHVNLICGFPGETLAEAEDTVAFVVDALADHPGATYLLNPFTVFPATPIADNPAAFGIRELSAPGDMPATYAFALDAPTLVLTGPVTRNRPALEARLHAALGWSDLCRTGAGQAALDLYFSSGHSAVFKAAPRNAMDVARRPSRRARAGPRPATPQPRAFLTGATGNVGGAVLTELLRRGYRVTALARDPGAVDAACERVVGDLRDLPDLSQVLPGMDAVIHCASPRSLDRTEVLACDVEGTARLLDAWQSGTFVGMSSQTVYGVPSAVLAEESPLAPDTWYDLAKTINESQVAMAAARADRGAGLSLRLPLVFGSGTRRRDRQFLGPLLDALREGRAFLFASEEAMARFGTVYVGAADLGRAIVDCVGLPESGAFNLAGGFVTWRDLVDTLGGLAGLPPRYIVRADAWPREGEFRLPQSRSEYDCTRFNALTGFVPGQTLRTILEDFLRAEDGALARVA